MICFKFNQQKTISALLYVATQLIKAGIKPDFHKIFKVLYFADERHLADYGRPITGDYYIAMEHGPVPSKLYDMLKIVRGDSISSDTQGFSQFFSVEGHYVRPLREPDMDEFSDSDIEYIDRTISENKTLTFNQLKDKSHDAAYKKATKDDRIPFRAMAKVAGASEDMLAYIRTTAENEQISCR